MTLNNKIANFANIWREQLSTKGLPRRITGITTLSYEQFKNLKDGFLEKEAKSLISELLDGKVLLVKEAFNQDFVDEIKNKVKEFWKNQPNTFYKMVEGCPDYHRIVTPEIAKNYSVGAVRHSTYFFPWNNDPCKFNERIYERWRYSKFLAGLDFKQYEANTPKDGSVDRIQIVCYPPKYGGVETHTDPSINSPLAVSGYLSSKKNKDFSSGGFYCVDKKNNRIDIEEYIDIGDMSLYCATIDHGVEPIDQNYDKDYDWNSGIGRWWMGLFTNDSNLKKSRNTSTSLEKYHSQKFFEKQ